MLRRRIRPSVFYCGDPRGREIIMEMNFDRYGGVEISTLSWHDSASTTMIPPSTIIFPTIFVPACKHPTVRYYEARCNIYMVYRYNLNGKVLFHIHIRGYRNQICAASPKRQYCKTFPRILSFIFRIFFFFYLNVDKFFLKHSKDLFLQYRD